MYRGLLGIFGLVLIIWGCGGTAAGDANEIPIETETEAVPQKTTNEKVDKGSPEKSSTKKVSEQADRFCKHEIEKCSKAPCELLNRKQIQACLVAIGPSVKKDCGTGVEKEVVCKIIIGKDGMVKGAFPVGEGADSTEAGCVAEKVKGVRFPSFTKQETLVIKKYPFKI